jgi:hypothetical protein
MHLPALQEARLCFALAIRRAVLLVSLALVVPAGECLAQSEVSLWKGLLEVQLPQAVKATRSGNSYVFRATGQAGSKMQLSVRRISRKGVRDASALYFAEYQRIKKAGGYRVKGATSSGPSTGDHCEIRYLLKPKPDGRQLHQVRAFYTKIGKAEWVQAVLSVRSTSWNSTSGKALRNVLASLGIGIP